MTMRKKFTLIELLIVIAVIAILLALLLPALQSAKQKVYTASCVNSMRQIGQAIYLYINDNNDYPPRTLRVGKLYAERKLHPEPQYDKIIRLAGGVQNPSSDDLPDALQRGGLASMAGRSGPRRVVEDLLFPCGQLSGLGGPV